MVAGIVLAAAALAVSCAGVAEGAKPGKRDTAAAARIGDRTITVDELDREVQVSNPQAVQAFYDARRTVLENMIREDLLEKEAEARGVTTEALLEQAVADVAPVDDAAVETFFNENQARMGGRPLDQVAGQIRNYLDAQNKQAAFNEFMGGLEKKNAVQVLLDPPRMEVAVAADDPTKGPADAPVTIVEFSDFQ